MKTILTLGEIMLRLACDDGHRLFQNDRLEATFGGGEANVAVSLVNFGLNSAYLTCLPDNPVGQAAINSLRCFGVDTSRIIRQGVRCGIYFMEKGASQRPSKVVYDRAYSAISMSKPEDYDWEVIFRDVNWLHFTGITPALSESMRAVTMDCLKQAKARNITVSCDLNYRKNLWDTETAKKTMTNYMPYVDVCIGNEEDAEKVLGIEASGTDVNTGKLSHEGYIDVAKTLCDRYGFSHVAISLRTSKTADDNDWAGMLYDGNDACFSRSYSMHIVDRVGGGDSFAAGLIYGLSTSIATSEAIEFAVAASCLKHTIQGDYNRVSVQEVKALLSGGGSGRVQR